MVAVMTVPRCLQASASFDGMSVGVPCSRATSRSPPPHGSHQPPSLGSPAGCGLNHNDRAGRCRRPIERPRFATGSLCRRTGIRLQRRGHISGRHLRAPSRRGTGTPSLDGRDLADLDEHVAGGDVERAEADQPDRREHDLDRPAELGEASDARPPRPLPAARARCSAGVSPIPAPGRRRSVPAPTTGPRRRSSVGVPSAGARRPARSPA